MKRVKLNHGSARVDNDCPQKTIDTLNEICERACEMDIEQLPQAVVMCCLYQGILNEPHAKCSRCGKQEWEHK